MTSPVSKCSLCPEARTCTFLYQDRKYFSEVSVLDSTRWLKKFNAHLPPLANLGIEGGGIKWRYNVGAEFAIHSLSCLCGLVMEWADTYIFNENHLASELSLLVGSSFQLHHRELHFFEVWNPLSVTHGETITMGLQQAGNRLLYGGTTIPMRSCVPVNKSYSV